MDFNETHELMSPKKLKSAMKNRENLFNFAVTFYIFTTKKKII